MAIDVRIEGMTCGGCIASLKKALEREGVSGVTVELGLAHVPSPADLPRVKAAVEKAGFTVAEQ